MKEQQVERASRIASLIIRRMQDSLSPQENAELEAWLHEDSENYLLYEEMMDETKLGADLAELQSIDYESAYQRLAAQTFHSTPVLVKNTRKIWYYAAAAVLVLSIGGYVMVSQMNKKPVTAPVLADKEQQLENIKPGTKKATLTLDNGTSIELDMNQKGIVAQQGNSLIQQSNPGNLYYTENGHQFSTGGAPPQNTLSIPRTGEYSVTLDDGTIVWLNSLSTLRFPVEFRGAERRVVLTGEAYFQVAKDPSKPFIVEVDDVEIKALGTEFNINAYAEEKKVQAALVEGAISVTRNKEQHILQPGTQAILPDKGNPKIEEADIEEVTAWKKGEFVFHATSLESIMNQFTRWYDIEVIYPKGIPTINFTGGLKRDDGITRIIHMLEMTGEVRFEVNGRIISVFPSR